jgi:hypothetical protein
MATAPMPDIELRASTNPGNSGETRRLTSC